MPRTANNVAAKKRRKKILKAAKGYWGARSKLYRTAVIAVENSWQYAYRDRKNKKRTFRRLWIIRINAGARLNGLSYSALINGLNLAKIELDRKALAFLAFNEPQAFAKVCEIAKSKLA